VRSLPLKKPGTDGGKDFQIGVKIYENIGKWAKLRYYLIIIFGKNILCSV